MSQVEVYLKRIGQLVEEHRLAKGDSQEELGVRLGGVSRHTVAKLENGHPSTKMSLVLKAAEFFDCLETFDNCMEQPVDPFKRYDEMQQNNKKRRVRRKR